MIAGLWNRKPCSRAIDPQRTIELSSFVNLHQARVVKRASSKAQRQAC